MNTMLRCLQIEDSESDAALIVRMLEKAKFRVQGERVESAQDLRAALSRQTWDIIIADFHLPGFDAYKALRVLKETGLDIPFIGISGKMGDEIAAEIMKKGAADYLTKNRLERLIPVIKRELREARMRQRQLAAEANLIAEKERLWVTLCSIEEGVITTDCKGKVTLVSPTAEKLLNCRQVLNRSLAKVFSPINCETRKPCLCPAGQVLKSGARYEAKGASIIIDSHGAELMVTHSAFPIKDGRGVIVGIVVVFRDVTDEEKLNEVLQNSNRLKSIGNIANKISHIFGNLLGGIWGNIELAREYCQRNNTEKVSERLGVALNIFARTKELTNQLLTLAQEKKPILKSMAIAPILCQAAVFVLRGSSIKLEADLPANLWPCSIDKSLFRQAIENIVMNSRQAMPDGGFIRISAENLPADSDEIPGLFAEDTVRIAIVDNGPGIVGEKRCRDDLFCPEATTKKGFGLAIVDLIMKQHQGSVKVESQPGQGTTFFLYLPRAESLELFDHSK